MEFAKKYFAILVLVILTGVPSVAFAQQVLHWVPTNGPYTPLTGDVNFLEADGHIFGSRIQSSDDGLTWDPFYSNPAYQPINGQSLSVDSQGRLYWYFDSFLYSSDTGITWSNNLPTPPGMTGTYDTLIIDGRGRLLEQKYSGTLYWTLDFGATWDSVKTSAYPYSYALNYDLQKGWYQEYVPDILNAGYGNNLFAWPDSENDGYESYFYHSENLEQTWKKITVDSGRRGILDSIYWFNDSSIWVATDSGLFLSNDSGNSFLPKGAGIPRTRIYLFRWINDSSIWVATDSGLFTSRDRAQTFAFSSGFSGNSIRSISLGVTNATVLAAYGNDSAYISHDGGSTWEPLPFQQVSYPADAFFTSNKGTIFLSNNGTVLSSRDNGYTWLQDAQDYISIDLLHSFKSTLWAEDNYNEPDDPLYLSSDYGANWLEEGIDTGYNGFEVFSNGTMFILLDSGVWFSSDSGRTWPYVLYRDTLGFLKYSALNDDTVWMIASNTNFLTPSQFAAWDSTPIGHNYLAIANPEIAYYYQISQSGTMWHWVPGVGIYTSKDFGKTWTFSIDPNDGPGLLYLDPNGFAYVPDGNVGLFVSYDEGKTWDTLPPCFVNQLCQVNTELFMIGSNSALSGVLLSLDSGRSWISENQGLEGRFIEQISSIGDTLFAATDGGVYIAVPQSVSAVKENANPINSTGLLSIVPNPSTNEITATVELSQPDFIELSLYDTRGVKLESMSEWQAESVSNYPFDLSKHSNGIYFLSLIQSDHAPVVQKIVKE